MSIASDIANIGLPPQWKVDAYHQLEANGYKQSKPWAVGGGAEASFLITHPTFLFYGDAAKTDSYKAWLVSSGIYTLTGLPYVETQIGAVVTAATKTVTTTPSYKLFMLAGIAIGAYIVYRKFIK